MIRKLCVSVAIITLVGCDAVADDAILMRCVDNEKPLSMFYIRVTPTSFGAFDQTKGEFADVCAIAECEIEISETVIKADIRDSMGTMLASREISRVTGAMFAMDNSSPDEEPTITQSNGQCEGIESLPKAI